MSKNAPPTIPATLDEARRISISGGIKVASIQHHPGGWILVLDTTSNGQCYITTERKKPRLFKNLETCARAAQSLFLDHCIVLLDNWDKNQPALTEQPQKGAKK